MGWVIDYLPHKPEVDDLERMLIFLDLAEFAVSCVDDIQWSDLPFQSLVIPVKKKDMLQALVLPYKPDAEERPFDDFVEGKGKGLIILLQ